MKHKLRSFLVGTALELLATRMKWSRWDSGNGRKMMLRSLVALAAGFEDLGQTCRGVPEPCAEACIEVHA